MRDLWNRLDRYGQASLFVVRLIGTAMFPRLAYRLRWQTRLRGRRLAIYVVFNALLLVGFKLLVFRMLRWRAGVIETLEAELGREPTPEEFRAAVDPYYLERVEARRRRADRAA
jgi:hypothetical protein